MNIIVIGGSPKGEISVTMQYVKWLKQNFREHNFEILYATKEIHKLERDEHFFQSAMDRVQKADAVFWAYPVYYGLVHSSLKRFIELVNERGHQNYFAGKHTAILSTSIHYFDHIAMNYLQGVLEDLGMQVDETFASGMHDLLEENGRRQLELFFRKWMEKLENGIVAERVTLPVTMQDQVYEPSGNKPAVYRMKVGIVTESGKNENLDKMTARMKESFTDVKVFDLSEMHIAGHCLGCLKCGYDNKCVYEGKDDVINTYRELKECDAILFSGFIKDRFLSARWKMFINRMFFTTHIPFLTGKTLGFVIAGPLRQLPGLREHLSGMYNGDELIIAGFAGDEGEDIEQGLDNLAASMHFCSKEKYTVPDNFLAVGGKHIFRDEIFCGLRGVFCADHKYYKKHGKYDFPHRKMGDRFITSLLYVGMKIPPVRKEIQSNMAEHMISSYRKLLETSS